MTNHEHTLAFAAFGGKQVVCYVDGVFASRAAWHLDHVAGKRA